MPARSTIVMTAAGAALVLAAGGAVATTLGDDDPDGTVDAVSVGALRQDDSTSTTAGSGSTTTAGGTQQVPALTELSGPVEQRDRSGDDDAWDDLYVSGVELELGPDSWIASAPASEDFDGNGRAEVLRTELAGLVGEDASFKVRLDDDGDDADVYMIGELTYRDPAGVAPWVAAGTGDDDGTPDQGSDDDGGSGDDSSDGDDSSGGDDSSDRSGSDDGAAAVAPSDDVRSLAALAAADAVGPGARVTEIDAEDDGNVAWEAKVLGADGVEHEVLLDAAGAVLDVRRDD